MVTFVTGSVWVWLFWNHGPDGPAPRVQCAMDCESLPIGFPHTKPKAPH